MKSESDRYLVLVKGEVDRYLVDLYSYNKNIPVLLYNCLARRNPYYKPDPGASTTSSSPAAGQSAQQSAAEPGMEI